MDYYHRLTLVHRSTKVTPTLYFPMPTKGTFLLDFTLLKYRPDFPKAKRAEQSGYQMYVYPDRFFSKNYNIFETVHA